MTNLYFGRYIDPDARAAAGDSSVTNNSLGYSTIPNTNVVMSEALSSKYALGLYTGQVGNVGAGISNIWTTDPANYYNGVNSGNGDYTIGLGFYVSSVSAGDIVTFQYAYIFGPTALAANQTAVDSGAGGGTPGEVPGCTTDCTITDPSSSPTVVSTATTNTVTSTSYVNTSLPVVTGSIASHVSTENTGTQTITRTTNTTVTTPMTTATTTTPVTTTTYSDGSTTSSTGTASTAYTYYNSVTSSSADTLFSGRIDQYERLAELNTGLSRGLNYNWFNPNSVETENGHAYINGSRSHQGLSHNYNADTNQWGLGFDHRVSDDLTVGVQHNRITSKMKGTDSDSTLTKNHYGLFAKKELGEYTLQTDLGLSLNSYSVKRNIENEFHNDSTADGRDVWLRNRLYFPQSQGFRPFVGVNVGESTINGTSENGSIQSARNIGKSKQDMNYGEAGLQYNKQVGRNELFVEGSTATDGHKELRVGIAHNHDANTKISLVATRQIDGNGYHSNGVGAMIKFEKKFWGACGFGPWKNEKQGCKDLEKQEAAQLDLRAEQARKKEIYEEMKKNPNLEYIKVNF